MLAIKDASRLQRRQISSAWPRHYRVLPRGNIIALLRPAAAKTTRSAFVKDHQAVHDAPSPRPESLDDVPCSPRPKVVAAGLRAGPRGRRVFSNSRQEGLRSWSTPPGRLAKPPHREISVLAGGAAPRHDASIASYLSVAGNKSRRRPRAPRGQPDYPAPRRPKPGLRLCRREIQGHRWDRLAGATLKPTILVSVSAGCQCDHTGALSTQLIYGQASRHCSPTTTHHDFSGRVGLRGHLRGQALSTTARVALSDHSLTTHARPAASLRPTRLVSCAASLAIHGLKALQR